MKYIDAEKIRAEIERLKDEYTDIAIDSHYGTVNANSVVDDLEQLLFLLNSLQQEQPEVDLEKEIKSWILNECGPSDFSPFADHWCADDIMATARHFYELGKNTK